jgi:copper chaperone CopZ
VIPAGLGLKKDGASNGATVGFLISTPQTGVDSILVSASFLGWPFALFKVLSATVTGLLGGWITDSVAGAPIEADRTAASAESGARGGFRAALDHAVDILRTIWRWVVFGVVVSAAIEVFVPEGLLTGLSEFGPVVPVLAALAVSLPLYVCAPASVPIAAALVAGGMPAGAALVFLMAGPATNVATIGAISRALGRRAVGVYLATIILGSVGAGIAFDFVLEAGALTLPHAHAHAAWWAVGSAVLLLAMVAWFALLDLLGLAGRLRQPGGGAAIEVGVSGMTCGGCVSKLERALRAENGVTSAVVTLEPGKAVIRGALKESRLREVVEDAGFKVDGWTSEAPSGN